MDRRAFIGAIAAGAVGAATTAPRDARSKLVRQICRAGCLDEGPLSTLAPGYARALESWVGNSYQRSDYSGWTYDAEGNQILFFGGGHGGGQETDIRAFDLTTLTWSSLYPSLSPEQKIPANMTSFGAWQVDGKLFPVARHTYNTTCVVGDRFYMFVKLPINSISPQYLPPNLVDVYVQQFPCWYDFTKQEWDWSHLKDPPDYKWGGWGPADCCPTPDGQILVICSLAGWADSILYDPATDSFRRLSPKILEGQQLFALRTVYNPQTDTYFAFCGHDNGQNFVQEIDLETETSKKRATSGDVPLTDYIQYGYDGHGKFGGCVAGGKYHEFDPATGVFTLRPIAIEAGSPPALPDTVFHCGAWVGEAYVFAGADGRTWAYRPGSAESSGLAATVARDTDLALHPDVVIYDNLVSREYIADNFGGVIATADGTTYYRPDLTHDCEIIDWPQYGLKAARCGSVTTNQRVVSWHHWGIPDTFPAAQKRPYMRPYGQGYTELYFRFLMRIDPDLAAGMTESGMKLPGLCGLFDYWDGDGAQFPQMATWQARLWMTPPGVNSLPGTCRLGVYYFAVDNKDIVYLNAPPHASTGTTAEGGITGIEISSAYLEMGRIYCIEQQIKLNSMAANNRSAWDYCVAGPGSPNFTVENLARAVAEVTANANPDGEMRLWVDGAKVYERTGMRIRGLDFARIQDMPFMNIYHGGMGLPKAPFHFDLGGVCVATKYIGVPRIV